MRVMDCYGPVSVCFDYMCACVCEQQLSSIICLIMLEAYTTSEFCTLTYESMYYHFPPYYLQARILVNNMRPRPLRNHSAYTTISSASGEYMNAYRHQVATRSCVCSQCQPNNASFNACVLLIIRSKKTCSSKHFFTFFHPSNLIGRRHASRLGPVKLRQAGWRLGCCPWRFQHDWIPSLTLIISGTTTLTTTFIHSLTLSLPQTSYLPLI
jgi:hypothetical protein